MKLTVGVWVISFIYGPKDLGLNEGVRNSHHERELTFKWNDENYILLLDLNMLTPYCVAVMEMTDSILRITWTWKMENKFNLHSFCQNVWEIEATLCLQAEY